MTSGRPSAELTNAAFPPVATSSSLPFFLLSQLPWSLSLSPINSPVILVLESSLSEFHPFPASD